MISIKQLRYLDAISRFSHFGKAAAHCAVTQPALSMQIQEMEKDLGVQLVERRPKGASLTEAGREIARRGGRILKEVRDIRDYARQAGRPLAAPIRLGVIPTVAPYVLPPLLPMLRERFPELDLHVRETHTQQLIAELIDGTLDLLVGASGRARRCRDHQAPRRSLPAGAAPRSPGARAHPGDARSLHERPPAPA